MTDTGPASDWDVDDTLRIRVRRVGPWDNAAYVVACPETDKAVLIDAANEPARLIEAVGELRLVAILETHGHQDHWQALAAVQAQFPSAWAGAHLADMEMFGEPPPGRELVHREIIQFGNRQLRVLHTPGHTPGSICFHHPGYIFTGDTLFPGGPGATRPPLGHFPTIVDSIRTHLLPLAPETVVYPGHGGPTTIGSEAPQFRSWVARGW